MFLLLLFIILAFIPVSHLLHCTGGPNCYITLGFDQIVPSNRILQEKCSTIEASACSVFLKLDYNDQRVDISFENTSNHVESSYHFIDLLKSNSQALIILRYTVVVENLDKNRIQLYILLQCQTHHRCTERQLRHFWPRFVSLNSRRDSLLRFYNFLNLNTSDSIHCYDDRINQSFQCSTLDNVCWASTDTQRKCMKYNRNLSNYFIYSYTKVHYPRLIVNENVSYILACHVNNCNNNETVKQVRKSRSKYC